MEVLQVRRDENDLFPLEDLNRSRFQFRPSAKPSPDATSHWNRKLNDVQQIPALLSPR